MQSYDILINKHVGENCFIVGAGTSLHGLDLSLIHNHIVISVNSSFIVMPWAAGAEDRRYFLSNDSAIRNWNYWDYVKKSKSIKIIRDSWKKYYDEIPDFLVFSPRTTSDGVINPEEKALCYSSSVPSSIDLAIQMGCKNIFLLGVDHYFSGNKSHFWQYWPKETQPVPLKTVVPPLVMQKYIFDLNEKSYEALETFSKLKKCNIFNCNPLSKIKHFNKIDYKQALDMVGSYGKILR